MKDDVRRRGPLGDGPDFRDKIESISDIKYEVSILLIDRLGLKAQAWLTELEAATEFHALQRAVFGIHTRLDREGKKEVVRELLTLWRNKTGYSTK